MIQHNILYVEFSMLWYADNKRAKQLIMATVLTVDQTIIDTVVERTQAVVCTLIPVCGLMWKYKYTIYVYRPL